MQAVLQSDNGMAALPGGGLNFERWIKHGLMTEDLLDNTNESSQQPLAHGVSLLFLPLAILHLNVIACTSLHFHMLLLPALCGSQLVLFLVPSTAVTSPSSSLMTLLSLEIQL